MLLQGCGCNPVVEHLHGMYEALGSISSVKKKWRANKNVME